MSSPNPATSKTKRSPLERIVVWGLIVLLGLVVALEYRGMSGYQKTLTAWEEKIEAVRIAGTSFPLTEAKAMASMSPAYSEPVSDGPRIETTAKWFTVLSFMPDRKYEIHLSLDKAEEGSNVLTITTAADREMEDEALSGEPAIINPATSAPPAAPAGGSQTAATGKGGGGRPTGGGGGQRRQRPGGGGNAVLGGGLDMGIIGKLMDPEVQKSLELTDEQLKSIKTLKEEAVTPGLQEINSAGLRTRDEKQGVLDGFLEDWTKQAQKIIGDDGIEALKKLTDSAE